MDKSHVYGERMTRTYVGSLSRIRQASLTSEHTRDRPSLIGGCVRAAVGHHRASGAQPCFQQQKVRAVGSPMPESHDVVHIVPGLSHAPGPKLRCRIAPRKCVEDFRSPLSANSRSDVASRSRCIMVQLVALPLAAMVCFWQKQSLSSYYRCCTLELAFD